MEARAFCPPQKKAPKVVVIDASWLMNCCQKKVCWKKCVLGDVSRCENVQNKYMFSWWSCWKFARKKKDPEINEEWSGSIVFKNNVYSQRGFQPWLFVRKRTSYSMYQFFLFKYSQWCWNNLQTDLCSLAAQRECCARGEPVVKKAGPQWWV